MNRSKRQYRLAALILVLAMAFSLAGCRGEQGPAISPLTVTLLKVGKADAIIAMSGSHTLLIDTGEEDDGEEVAEFLKNNSVRQVDAMIITHFDQDHVGGADTVIEEIPVKSVYVPDYRGTHQEYLDFLTAAEAAHVPVQPLQEPVTLPFGDGEVRIEPPPSYEIPEGTEDYDNNFSLITTITHGENSMVFMGDAEKQEIRQWLQESQPEKCSFLKVPHHGIYNTALEELFSTLSPEYAVICSSQKHPAEQKTLELLKKYCPAIYETKDGNVTVLSDGSHLELYQKLRK